MSRRVSEGGEESWLEARQLLNRKVLLATSFRVIGSLVISWRKADKPLAHVLKPRTSLLPLGERSVDGIDGIRQQADGSNNCVHGKSHMADSFIILSILAAETQSALNSLPELTGFSVGFSVGMTERRCWSGVKGRLSAFTVGHKKLEGLTGSNSERINYAAWSLKLLVLANVFVQMTTLVQLAH
ncbi:hypothetical protein PC116_g4673 [Phytophthora cactorum]|nr:hypothetical protein PC116_g4673 [Phytophthora cactorum]